MPYKLVYFPVRGRAQCIRYMLIDNDIPFEERIVAIDEWTSVKSTFMFGQLPVLYDGDFEIPQTNAILNYLARKHGLYGKDEKEMAQVDFIRDQRDDLFNAYVQLVWGQFEEKKEEFIKNLPDKLKVFEKKLSENNGGSGYFVGSKVTLADYCVFDTIDALMKLEPKCLEAFPILKAFHGRLASRDKLAKYRDTEKIKSMCIFGNFKL